VSLLEPRHILFSYLHLAADQALTRGLMHAIELLDQRASASTAS
jgi:alanine dehydrogenase